MKKFIQENQVDQRILHQHSERVSKIISELLGQGAIGIEVALLIDSIDDPTVLLQSYKKPELIHNLYVVAKKIKEHSGGKLTPRKAERLNVLLNTLSRYIDGVSAELFMNQNVQAHAAILKHGIELYKQRNFSVLRR
ncbi:MAG: hypothetical protein BroJett025_01460 [Patescibacteria group bacterium]|nr:MAG: hypothetical protein BroJett025_01460 [Patescibacteria group bacterium]